MLPTTIPPSNPHVTIEISTIKQELYQQLPEDEETQFQSFFPQNGPLKHRIYIFFENPRSCKGAYLFSMWILCLIAVSTIVFVIETVKDIHIAMGDTFWIAAEVFCVTWFTVEYVVRIATAPQRWKFFLSGMNFIDFLAIAPFYFGIIFGLSGTGSPVLRTLRLLRIFRIFKFGRYSSGMQLLAATMKQSASTLLLLTAYLAIAMIVCSSVMYFVECGNAVSGADGSVVYVRSGETNPSPFSSIPATFWYTLVTMTTVGYGDVVPITPLGKLCGSITMICGIIVIALPLNLIGGNFIYQSKLHEKSNRLAQFGRLSHHRSGHIFEVSCSEMKEAIEMVKRGTLLAESVLRRLEENRIKFVQMEMDAVEMVTVQA